MLRSSVAAASFFGIVCGPGPLDPNIGPGRSTKPKGGGCGPGRVPLKPRSSGSRQLWHQWCDFLVADVGLVELSHSKQVGTSETAQSRFDSGDVLRQLFHYPVTPLSSFDLAADRCAYLPVEMRSERALLQRQQSGLGGLLGLLQ